MGVYKVHGSVVVDIYVEVEAESLEEAIELCEGDVSVTEYCDGTVGVEYCDDGIEELEVFGGNDIEWEENVW